jgi:DNA-3-methyladenine glycosylase
LSRRLERSFFERDALEVAPDLLGKVLVAGDRAGRIVEVEAYRGHDDPGSHGHRGPTPRTRTMFGPPGHLYVYFSYGMHWCANVVCDEDGTCAAVLVRALAPTDGVAAMFEDRRAARSESDLCSGPAKLCQALGINGDHDGVDLVVAEAGVEIREDSTTVDCFNTSTRIGLAPHKGADLPWRFYVAGDPNVSGRPR